MKPEGLFTSADHVAVVVAHPGDETFGCGSIIASAAASRARVSLVCATRGEAGEVTEAAARRRASLGQIRELELRRAAEILGVRQVHLLDYADSGVAGALPQGALCATDAQALGRLVAIILQRLQATVVVALDGCDGHRDHVHLREAVVAAARDLGCRLYLATIPNSLMRGWVEERHSNGACNSDHELGPDRIGCPDAHVTHSVDACEHLELRLRAIAAHASQRSPFDGLSPALREAFLCTDHLIEIDLCPSPADA